MTTYTKTQLIDMAIDKLGEDPEWGVHGCVSISTIESTTYGFGVFDICDERDIINKYWQLVCTRQEFEQRVAERNGSWWDFSKSEALRLPPIGCKVLYEDNVVEVVEVTNNPQKQICAKFADGQLAILNLYWIKHLNHKPKLTERQQAGLKLWRAINFNDAESDEFIISQKRFEDYCKPYDQGMLK